MVYCVFQPSRLHPLSPWEALPRVDFLNFQDWSEMVGAKGATREPTYHAYSGAPNSAFLKVKPHQSGLQMSRAVFQLLNPQKSTS